MKKIILLITVTSLLLGCSKSDNSSTTNTSNSNVNYYFKIKINGIEHKVQGNTSGFGSGIYNLYNQNPNDCYAQIGTTTLLLLKIADITKPNYVSGQNLHIIISIPNCHVGLNQASVIINTSPVRDAFISSSVPNGFSAWVENSGLYCFSNCQNYPLASTYDSKITLNITDMGTAGQYPSTNPEYLMSYGSTFKGSYNGPVYFTAESNSTSIPKNFNIPMQFSLEFEAYRVN